MIERPRRSVLFLPADNPRAVEKAKTLACDVVVLDLEDAVGPSGKDAARAAAIKAVRNGGFAGSEVWVRVNGPDTALFGYDLAALAGEPVQGLVIPKIEGPKDLIRTRAEIKRVASRSPALWAMIETPLALMNLAKIGEAARSQGVVGLLAGGNDLGKALGAGGEARFGLVPHLAQIVACSRAYGLVALDAVYNDLEDEAGLAVECAQGVALGFDGKTLIHPNQIEAANKAFAPGPKAIARAQAIVAAFADPENAGKGVVRIDGVMAERLHLDAARLVLARAGLDADQAADGGDGSAVGEDETVEIGAT